MTRLRTPLTATRIEFDMWNRDFGKNCGAFSEIVIPPTGRNNRGTLVELVAAFRDVFPDLGEDTMLHDIQGVLDALVTAELACIDE